MNIKGFKSIFDQLANHKNRYEVFRDFVVMSAAALHNAVRMDERLENDYMAIVKQYKKEELLQFTHLLAEVIEMLEVEPTDVLGQLYMQLELGNKHSGQFFTPPHVSELMAKIGYVDCFKMAEKEFVTLSEPACGAGGMVMAFVKMMIEQEIDPARHLWVQAIDIDRTVALMCFIQLTLWNVPAQVCIGNTLSMEIREVYHTPAHYLFNWNYRLNRRSREQEALALVCDDKTYGADTDDEPSTIRPMRDGEQMTLF